jgi:hypothetical protein
VFKNIEGVSVAINTEDLRPYIHFIMKLICLVIGEGLVLIDAGTDVVTVYDILVLEYTIRKAQKN